MRVARYYCPTAHETFSLLPDCVASHFPGGLAAIEDVVAAVEDARSVEAAADTLRRTTTGTRHQQSNAAINDRGTAEPPQGRGS